jgi:protein ImuB
MLWAALLPDAPPHEPPSDPSRRTDALAGIALWCLQFTPRVALLETVAAPCAVAMELEASVRLFGGKRRLVERVRDEAAALGIKQIEQALSDEAGDDQP